MVYNPAKKLAIVYLKCKYKHRQGACTLSDEPVSGPHFNAHVILGNTTSHLQTVVAKPSGFTQTRIWKFIHLSYTSGQRKENVALISLPMRT